MKSSRILVVSALLVFGAASQAAPDRRERRPRADDRRRRKRNGRQGHGRKVALADPSRPDRSLLLETAAADGSALAGAAVHTPRWVYSDYVNGEAELYDLSNDPDELRSLHADPTMSTVRADLARRLAVLRSCSGAACRRGPSLRSSVRTGGICPAATGEVTLRGADLGRVTRVRFLAGEAVLSIDETAPYRAAIRLRARPSFVRVHAVLDDGRELTQDLRVRGCASE